MADLDRAALLAAAKAAARDHTNHVARTAAVLEFRQVADPTTIVTLCSELDAAASEYAALHAALEQLADEWDAVAEGMLDPGPQRQLQVRVRVLRRILAAHPAPDERDNRIRAEERERIAALAAPTKNPYWVSVRKSALDLPEPAAPSIAAHPAPDERDNRIRAEAFDETRAFVDGVNKPSRTAIVKWLRNAARIARDTSPPEKEAPDAGQ